MLGRLLSSASSATTSPSATRPSTAAGYEGEDLYTRTLLYPDTSLLSHGGSLSSSGYISASGGSADGEHIDIDCARDIRVIIGQEGGSGSDGKSVVYDSKPGASFPTQQCNSSNYQPISGFDDAPPSPGLYGGFSRRRRSPAPFNPSYSPHSGSGIAGRDEWMLITDCMFGNVAMAYKGPSTKLHILPGLPQDNKSGSTTPAIEGRSKGRNSFHSHHTPSPFSPQSFLTKSRKSVLITRLFSVVIPPTTSGRTFLPQEQSLPGSLNAPNGFPFPRMPQQQTQASGCTTPKPMKPVKTSMYAIGLVVSLPPSTSVSNSIKRCPNCWSLDYDIDSRRAGHGYYCCDVAAASMDDEYRADQVLVESNPDSGIAEDQMEYITKNWDIITRALADLQSVAQAKIIEGLLAAGISSPTSSQPSYKYRNRVELRPGALMYDETLRLEVERFRWRVVSGIKIPRVVTGQGRWGVWREEARSLNKRLGGKDQNFLFLTLLTAFLGHHKEWLDVLGPVEYRCKHQMQKQFSSATNEDTVIPSRTVVISHDKISARKLIYLLSAFLPAKSLPAWPSPDHAFLPSRTSSTNLLSQSPPAMSYMSQNSRGSVRQKPRKRPSKLSMIHGETGDAGGWDIPVTHSSDASVLRQQTDSLQLVPSAGSTRKSCIIHPHPITSSASKFTDGHQKESRPGSSGSTASFSLMHALRKTGTGNASTDSSTTGSTGTSGWSFLSNIWSLPRNSSTGCTSEASTHPDELMDCPTRSSTGISGEKFEEEVVVHDHDLYPGYEDQLQSPPRYDNYTRTFTHDTPLNISIGEDGIVDVELPPAPLLGNSVFGHSSANTSSPIGSPGGLGYSFSMLSLDRSSLAGSSLLQSTDDTNDITMNVAGWMDDERFHPDFALQAVKPYCELEADVKRAMRSEPTPTGKYRAPGQWVTVCSVLLADTRNFTIKRLTLKRKKINTPSNNSNSNQTPSTPLTAFFDPISPSFRRLPSATYSDDDGSAEEEKFEEEWVMDMDDILATAVERTIGVDVDSRAQTKHNKPRSLLGKDTTPSTPEVVNSRNHGSDCKSIILGALQEVVKKCVGGRAGEPGLVENFLTEGVLQWLDDVEDFPPHTAYQPLQT